MDMTFIWIQSAFWLDRGGFIEYLLLIAPFSIAYFVEIVSKVSAEELKTHPCQKQGTVRRAFSWLWFLAVKHRDYASFW